MRNLISMAVLLFGWPAFAQVRTVTVNTNGVLAYPTNLFALNSNALNVSVAHPTNGLATLVEVTNLVSGATNWVGTNFMLASNTNFSSLNVTGGVTAASFTGDGAGLTNSLGATNQFQFVTLSQLESYLGAGQHMWFYGSSNIAGAMNVGATVTTNWAYSTASTGTAVTNTYAAVTNGQYLASYVSADTFRNILSGSVSGEIYAYKGGNPSHTAGIKMEVYLFDTVGGTNIYEFEPSPAYQALTTTKTLYRFSIPTIDYSYATDLRVVAKIKATVTGSPTVYLSTEGADSSHAAITVPAATGAGEANTASSLGNGYRLFQDKSGVDLRFNTVTNGSGIAISSNANMLSISVDPAFAQGSSNITDSAFVAVARNLTVSTNLMSPSSQLAAVTAGSILLTNATASKAVVTDAASNLTNSATTSTEIGYVSGVTSAIQTQLGTKLATTSYYGWSGFAITTGDIATSNITSGVNVTGLTFTPEANKTYWIRAVLPSTSGATTTGVRYGLTGPGSPTAVSYSTTMPTLAAGSPHSASATAFAAWCDATTGPGTTRTPIILEGIIRNGANSSAVQVLVRSEIANSWVTNFTGSVLMWQLLN
jgi:hypothetical protein